MSDLKLTPMRLFALKLTANGGGLSPNTLAHKYAESKGDYLKAASRDCFGSVSTAYQRCRELKKAGYFKDVGTSKKYEIFIITEKGLAALTDYLKPYFIKEARKQFGHFEGIKINVNTLESIIDLVENFIKSFANHYGVPAKLFYEFIEIIDNTLIIDPQ